MKVRELIAKLQEFDQELSVWIETCCELGKAGTVELSELTEEGKILMIKSINE